MRPHLWLLLLQCYASWGQLPPAPTGPLPPTWKPISLPSLGPIEFGGWVDGYRSLNFNHPASHLNRLHFFDIKANEFGVAMAGITAEHDPDPIGFKFQALFGHADDLLNEEEPNKFGLWRHVIQGYVSFKPKDKKWRGVQVDVGKFVPAVGAEVLETYLNWNYSRGFLFVNGPFFFFGTRITVPVGKKWTLGYHFVKGWTIVEDNRFGKTQAISAAYSSRRLLWIGNYYFGPTTAPGSPWRHFADTVLTINPNGYWRAVVSADYGQQGNPGVGTSRFYGWVVAARMPIAKQIAFNPRYEWYRDPAGIITKVPQTLQEVTLTLQYKMRKSVIGYVEYRTDWSSKNFFDRGNQSFNASSQTTLLAALLLYFGK